MKVFLIGMPGAGKSTIGRELALTLNLAFIDLDQEIETREHQSVSGIFLQHGEAYFRLTESQILIEHAGSSNSFVMATGGGTPCFHEGIKTMNQTGISIFLDVPVSVLVERVAALSHRPLLTSTNRDELLLKLATLRETRLPYYQQASIAVPNPTAALVMQKLELKR
jgi:shikimate kinase